MTSSDKTFGRQWQLIQLLSESAQGQTVKELAEKIGCTPRSLKRHLASFREYDIPLVEETGKHGAKTYRIAWLSAMPSFSFDEVAAVYIARRFMEPMMGTFFWQAMQNALKKMRDCLGTSMIRNLERSIGVIELTGFAHGDYQKFAPLIDDLELAVSEKRQISILYRSIKDTEASTTTVDPYGLIYTSGSLYLVGFSHKRGDIRHWKIDRIGGVTVLNETFQPPEDFHLSEYAGQLFGAFKNNDGRPSQSVRIRFQPLFARQVQEKRWHATQQFFEQPDGSVILELMIDDLNMLKSWILGYGPHAEVLEPQELRDEILKDAELTAAQYRLKPPKPHPMKRRKP